MRARRRQEAAALREAYAPAAWWCPECAPPAAVAGRMLWASDWLDWACGDADAPHPGAPPWAAAAARRDGSRRRLAEGEGGARAEQNAEDEEEDEGNEKDEDAAGIVADEDRDSAEPPRPQGAARAAWRVARLADTVLRGASQALFLSNPLCGALIVAAMFFCDAWTPCAALLGAASASLFASALGLPHTLVRSGLCGQAAFWFGAAFAAYVDRGNGESWQGAALVAAFACLSVLVAAGVAAVFAPFDTPALTVPADLCMLALALGSTGYPFFALDYEGPASPPFAAGDGQYGALSAQLAVEAVLRGVAQIVFAPSPWTGLVLVAASALCSPRVPAALLAGSLIGGVVGYAMGASDTLLRAGAWGASPALVAAIHYDVMLKPSPRTALLAAFAASLAAFAFGAARAMTLLWGVPPFFLAVSTAGVLSLAARSSLRGVADSEAFVLGRRLIAAQGSASSLHSLQSGAAASPSPREGRAELDRRLVSLYLFRRPGPLLKARLRHSGQAASHVAEARTTWAAI
jgi:urea transporter